jgi:hypothetical protein
MFKRAWGYNVIHIYLDILEAICDKQSYGERTTNRSSVEYINWHEGVIYMAGRRGWKGA